MKFAMALLVTTIAATSTFAAETLCFDAKLKRSYPQTLKCEQVLKLCVKGFELDSNPDNEAKSKASSLVVTNSAGKSLKMTFKDGKIQNDDDIDAHLLHNFSSKKTDIKAELEVETSYGDYEVHGTITGTYATMTLWNVVNVKKDQFQYQSCNYTLSK